MARFHSLFSVLMVLALVVATRVYGQTDENLSAEEKAELIHDWASTIAGQIEIRVTGQPHPCKLKEGSLLHWSNPIAGEVFGDCYLWTSEMRPVAFMSVYAFFSPQSNRRVTLQSISEQPLTATHQGKIIWTPVASGLEWLTLVNLPRPERSGPVRQRQMKLVAATFSAEIAEAVKPEAMRGLRLLSQPLYRYEGDGKIDGALFGFVDGTDPEVLLLIECYGEGESRFRVAAIRQNHRRLVVKRESDTVWEAPQLAPPFPNPKISDPDGVYFNARWDDLVE